MTKSVIPTKYQSQPYIHEYSETKPFPIEENTSDEEDEIEEVENVTPEWRQHVYPAASLQWSYPPMPPEYGNLVMYNPVPFMRPTVAASNEYANFDAVETNESTVDRGRVQFKPADKTPMQQTDWQQADYHSSAVEWSYEPMSQQYESPVMFDSVGVRKPCIAVSKEDAACDAITTGDGKLYRGRARSRSTSVERSAHSETYERPVKQIPPRISICRLNGEKVDAAIMTCLDDFPSNKNKPTTTTSWTHYDPPNSVPKTSKQHKIKITQCPVVKSEIAIQCRDGGRGSVERFNDNITESPSHYNCGKYQQTYSNTADSELWDHGDSCNERITANIAQCQASARYKLPSIDLSSTKLCTAGSSPMFIDGKKSDSKLGDCNTNKKHTSPAKLYNWNTSVDNRETHQGLVSTVKLFTAPPYSGFNPTADMEHHNSYLEDIKAAFYDLET